MQEGVKQWYRCSADRMGRICVPSFPDSASVPINNRGFTTVIRESTFMVKGKFTDCVWLNVSTFLLNPFMWKQETNLPHNDFHFQNISNSMYFKYLKTCKHKSKIKFLLLICEIVGRNNLLVTLSLSQKHHRFCDCLLWLSPKIYVRVSTNCQEFLTKAAEC